jgi:hypothetical protein
MIVHVSVSPLKPMECSDLHLLFFFGMETLIITSACDCSIFFYCNDRLWTDQNLLDGFWLKWEGKSFEISITPILCMGRKNRFKEQHHPFFGKSKSIVALSDNVLFYIHAGRDVYTNLRHADPCLRFTFPHYRGAWILRLWKLP